jgi:ribosome biogenesis GTPase / thiamine phosphate phosphatase
MTPDLAQLGWSPFFSSQFGRFHAEDCQPGRIAIQQKTQYVVVTASGELRAHIAGKLRFTAGRNIDLPVVGDWVAVRKHRQEERGSIIAVLSRRTKFSRKVAGREAEEQIMASNVDVVFLVNALDETFNLRRLERYHVLAVESGALPVVLLNKADLCDRPADFLREIQQITGSSAVHLTSAKRDTGLEILQTYLGLGITGALLGPSGVGKSTIINRLLGVEKLKTSEVRDYDSKGRHTTSHRELVLLPTGGLLIDTPGMRELQLWEGQEGVGETFGDIEELAESCRFRDCRHDTEPGCAVLRALEEGTLDQARFASYAKLQRELEHQMRMSSPTARAKQKARVKALTSAHKRGPKR